MAVSPVLGQCRSIRSVNTNVELKSLNLTPTAAGARSLHILNKSTFGKAGDIAAGGDDVLGGFPECQPYLHFKEGD